MKKILFIIALLWSAWASAQFPTNYVKRNTREGIIATAADSSMTAPASGNHNAKGGGWKRAGDIQIDTVGSDSGFYYGTNNGAYIRLARAGEASGGGVSLTDSLRIDSLNKRYSITTFGDSFTAGFTDLVGGYPEKLSNTSGRIVVNNGIGGATSTVILNDFLAKRSQWLSSVIIWSGYNNRDQATLIISECKRMADSLISIGNNRFLFLVIPNGPGDSAVGATHYLWYDSIIKVKNNLSALYPGHVVDVRSFLVSKYNPSLPNDVTAHNEDQIPPSLRTEAYPNGVHLTTQGYFYVARLIDSAYGNIIYERDIDDKPLSANDAINLIQGLILQMNVAPTGSYSIGNRQMLYRADRYTAPDNYIGSDGGRLLTTGSKNTTLGFGAGLALTTAAENVLIGYNVGKLLTTPNNNVFIGSSSGTNTALAADNVAVGYQTVLGSGQFLRNTAVGSTSQRSLSTGTDNSSLGQGSLSGNVDGLNNSIVGRASAANGTSINRISVLGANSCTSCTVGDVSSLGYQALFQNTSGIFNTGAGEYSIYGNNTGSWNTALGAYSQWASNAGTFSFFSNTSAGHKSLYQIRTGADGNTAFGNKAITDSITGDHNGAFGDSLEFPSRTESEQMNLMGYIIARHGRGYGSNAGTGNIGMGTNNPDLSAVLDLTSTTKGLLAPRMNTTQQNAISSPATGLLIYNTDSSLFRYYTGSVWTSIAPGSGGGGGGGGITALTGDVTASGSGSVAATLATVNSNVGSFTNANITVNAKGLITAASNGSGGGGSPGGSDTYVQFNRNGAFTGVDSLTWTSNGLDNKYRYRINSVQVAWLPNQTSFPSVMYLGNGTGSALASGATLNTAVGLGGALGANTTGASNTGMGARSFQANTTGSNNSGFGDAVGFSNSTGANNTYGGKSAGQSNTTSSNITGFGYNALLNNTGAQNTGIGASAMNSNSSGADNTAGGFQAGYQNATGTQNTSWGSGAATGTGGNNYSNNTAIGYFSMHSITTASSNTGVGTSTFTNLTTGGSNTALGLNAGQGIATGSNNLSLGDGINGFAAAQSGTVAIGANSLRRIWINSAGRLTFGGQLGVPNTDTANTGAWVKLPAGNDGNSPEAYQPGVLVTIIAPFSKEANANGTYQTSNALNRYAEGGYIADFYTDATNTSTTETDLYSYTTKSNTLAADGEKVIAEFTGINLGSATAARTIKAYFAGVQISSSGAITNTATSDWKVKIIVIRTSSTTVRCVVEYAYTSAGVGVTNTDETDVTSLTLSGTNILKITGQATGTGAASSDITAKFGAVSWYGASNN